MQLCVVLTRDDLAALVGEIAPLEVELSRRPRRAVALGRPSLVALVSGAGLRVRGDARFAWDTLGVTIPVTVRAWQILLAPAIVVVDGVLTLAFDPKLEALDLSNVPSFVSDAVGQAVANGLASQRKKLVWQLGKQLALTKALPERVSPSARFELAPCAGEVVVSESDVRLSLRFEAHVVRRPAMAPVSRRSA